MLSLKHVPGLGEGHKWEHVIREGAVKIGPQRTLILLMSKVPWKGGLKTLEDCTVGFACLLKAKRALPLG